MKWSCAGGIITMTFFVLLSAVPAAWTSDRDRRVHYGERVKHQGQRLEKRLSRDDQRALQRNYDYWSRLSAQQKNECNIRLHQFQCLPSNKRKALRGNYDRWKQMSDDRRNTLRERYQRWQALPQEEKQRLQEKVRCRRPCPM